MEAEEGAAPSASLVLLRIGTQHARYAGHELLRTAMRGWPQRILLLAISLVALVILLSLGSGDDDKKAEQEASMQR